MSIPIDLSPQEITPEDSSGPIYLVEAQEVTTSSDIPSPDVLIQQQVDAQETAIQEVVTKLGLSEETARLMVTGQQSIQQ